MIRRLTKKDIISVLIFFDTCKDKYEDCYITKNKQRTFLKGNLALIKKLLYYQTVYGVFNKELDAVMIIYREKNYRTYIKLLSLKKEYYNDLLKFLNWNYNEEFFVKIKKSNPLVFDLKRNKFFVDGFRGQEILLKKIKEIRNDTTKYNVSKS